MELLVHALGGRFASTACPWVRACDRPGWYWLDGEPLIHDTGALSGGERRVLSIVGALVSGLAVSHLAGILADLDRENLRLVLAACAHAAGSHEQPEMRPHGDRLLYQKLPPVVAWPDLVRVAS